MRKLCLFMLGPKSAEALFSSHTEVQCDLAGYHFNTQWCVLLRGMCCQTLTGLHVSGALVQRGLTWPRLCMRSGATV